MKVGIFGGTFNPPHLGHLIVAEYVRVELSLDRVVFIPAAIPPHKLNEQVTSPKHRISMLRLAIQDNPHFDISETEFYRGGISFTVDTLQELASKSPHDELFLMIGMDNLTEFHTWKSPDKILELAEVIVMTRPGFAESETPFLKNNKMKTCVVPEIGISSREIRWRIRQGRSIRYLLPNAVEEYIHRNHVYPAT